MRLKAPVVTPGLLAATVAILLIVIPHAASSTWLALPPGNDWGNGAGWMLNTVPNGSGQIATFGIVLSAAASSYTIITATSAALRHLPHEQNNHNLRTR